MTDAELAALKALADAATPGPWEAELTGDCYTIFGMDGCAEYIEIVRTDHLNPIFDDGDNAAFIAAARAAVPALIAEVERLRAELAEAQAKSSHPTP